MRYERKFSPDFGQDPRDRCFALIVDLAKPATFDFTFEYKRLSMS